MLFFLIFRDNCKVIYVQECDAEKIKDCIPIGGYRKKCTTTTEQKCTTEKTRQCNKNHYGGYECKDVEVPKCVDIPVKTCRKVPRQKCKTSRIPKLETCVAVPHTECEQVTVKTNCRQVPEFLPIYDPFQECQIQINDFIYINETIPAENCTQVEVPVCKTKYREECHYEKKQHCAYHKVKQCNPYLKYLCSYVDVPKCKFNFLQVVF